MIYVIDSMAICQVQIDKIIMVIEEYLKENLDVDGFDDIK